MSTIVNHHNSVDILNPEILFAQNKQKPKKVKILDIVSNPKTKQHELTLESQLFSEEPVNVSVHGNKLNLIVSELVDVSRSTKLQHYNWQSYFYQSYTRMQNITVFLPGDNFFMIRSFLIPEKFLLKIILGQLIHN